MYAPSFDAESAAAIAAEHFGVHGSARQLPSERDQNFLITNSADQKFVLKIANALEDPALLDAQSAVLKHLEPRISFCQRLAPALSGEEMVTVQGPNEATHIVRLVHYLPGVPLAEIKPQPNELLRDLGRKLGELDRAITDFDHPAIHRDFHWDLANGNRILSEYSDFIKDLNLRELVSKCRFDITRDLRRSVIHGDANDYNVLVDPERVTVVGLIDFGDMVYSYTVGNLAVALAYVVLDKTDPVAVAREVVEGYTSEFRLTEDELDALWPLVLMRQLMSVCLAAYQQQQRPENEYLQISQRSIAANLPRLLEITDLRG
ncbi:MAG TPA: phosphotransferase [Pyrinomonadaceae bacterium]|nr:phosphotransferase [Pyrinomonadaceae bacterium]